MLLKLCPDLDGWTILWMAHEENGLVSLQFFKVTSSLVSNTMRMGALGQTRLPSSGENNNLYYYSKYRNGFLCAVD